MKLSMILSVSLGLIAVVSARPQFVAEIPNGNAGARPGSGITCQVLGHQNCVPGAPRNPFGIDFMKAGFKWTKALCEKDSDGDGLTNGQELGDPCCEWTKSGGGALRLRSLSHPGERTDTNNAPKGCPKKEKTCGDGFNPKKQAVCSMTNFRSAKVGKYTIKATASVLNNAVDFIVSVTGIPPAVVTVAKASINGDSKRRDTGKINKPRAKITTRFYKALDKLPVLKGRSSCCVPPNGNRLPMSVEVQVCRKSNIRQCAAKKVLRGLLAVKCDNVCKGTPRGTVLVMSKRRKCPACRK